MSEPSNESLDACFCCRLHSNCDPAGCDQHRHSSRGGRGFKFSELDQSADNGCKTCVTLLSGLKLPLVKEAWMVSISLALKSGRAGLEARGLTDVSDAVTIEMLASHGRVVLRTRASFSSKDWRHFNFSVAPSLSTAACKPFPVLQSFPVDRTDSEITYKHLKGWIDICETNHGCTPKSPPQLPKRVLKISGDRLVLYLSGNNEHARYTTLSHRWGLNEDFVLKNCNLQRLTQGVAWSDLPKTAQDAVDISRKLGIDYLWIDSLCIIQEDDDDWVDQSRKMSVIYSDSWLNIAAADSDNSHGGCFRQGEATTRFTFHRVPANPEVFVMQQPSNTHQNFGSNYPNNTASSPLLQRGWVLQERLLAPRVVYYAKDEILWECNEMSDCQCGAITVIARFKPYHHRSLTTGDPLPYAWMRVAERYSGLKLTYETDRLIALAGIAKQALASGRGDEYLAGLWSKDLAHQLCWSVLDTWRKPDCYLTPSWSWLSVLGRVQFTAPYEYKALKSSQIDVQITDAACKGRNSSVFDDLESGYVKVRGRVLDMEAEALILPQGQRARFRLWRQLEGIGFEYNNFKADYIMDPVGRQP